MNSNNHFSIDTSTDSFITESKKLQENISYALKNSEKLKMEEIIGLYFHVINVSSLTKSLMGNDSSFEKFGSQILNKIKETEEHIDKKFNTNLHLLLMKQLEKKIEYSKNALKNIKSKLDVKNKSEIESQAKLFEELRQLMSTKEFVNQYDQILKKST